ncbi:MAG: PadR family transcriptional regulator [Candidatus Micrarchaeia archaeon]
MSAPASTGAAAKRWRASNGECTDKYERAGKHAKPARKRGNPMPANESKPMNRLNYSLTHGNIWLAALSLMHRRKAYAYALPGEISRAFGYKPSKLMAYFVLYKLEEEKLISSKFEGRRKYYALTPAGKKALSEGKKLLSSLAKKL